MQKVSSSKYVVRNRKSAYRVLRTAYLLILLTACATPEKKEDHMELTRASFSELPGWGTDMVAEALPPLQKSCNVILNKEPSDNLAEDPTFGKVADWAVPCRAIAAKSEVSHLETMKFFETYFVPYRVTNNLDPHGLVTGYYEIEVKASPVRTKEYHEPIYRTPPGMEKPYFTRAEIDCGALRGKGLEIAYAKDPVDVFFMQIQGSGRLVYPDGRAQLIGYDGQNGHEYFAIGKALIEMGEMTKEEVTAPAIMKWLRTHPNKMREVMQMNKSYVFFRKLDTENPIGAQRVELTPERSIAVDRRFIPYGAPIWLVSESPETPGYQKSEIRKLMIAQDTGGAIKGPVRGDYFWGAGDKAAEKAGHMKSASNFYVLVPSEMCRMDQVALNQ